MLVRQVWRLVHDTDSLFYRVFKAKYFPIGSIFDAKTKSGSYAWKSILKARGDFESSNSVKTPLNV